MNVQTAPSPYTPVGGAHTQSGNPPVLGSQTLGNTGGLPQPSGLSASANPMAEQLRSMGRDEDTMLVHMTPGEVNSLQGLAAAAGGSLTINPSTGLPEAGFLKQLLPMLAGIGLNFILPGSGIVASLGGKAATAGLITAAGGTALTGDLNKGLMAGLQAFGGASLAGGLSGAMGGAANEGAKMGAQELAKNMAGSAGTDLAKTAGQDLLVGASKGAANAAASAPGMGANALAKQGSGFLSQFGDAARGTMTGMGAKAAPMAAGMGVLSGLSDATAPRMPTYGGEENTSKYVPMGPGKREVRFQTPEQMRESGGAEFSYFTPSNPDPVPLYGERGYAEGGSVEPQNDLSSLISMYQSQNPGAITASMYPQPSTPPAAPAPNAPPAAILPPRGGEVMHNFGRPAAPTTRPSIMDGLGSIMGGLGGNIGGADSGGFGEVIRRAVNNSRSAPRASMLGGSEERPFQNDFLPLHQYADGGVVDMDNGSFVVDARTVSELGNGSSNAGIEMLTRMGGRPVTGPGDGVSDSVKARIGGAQEARVARDEVIFSPEAVRRLGNGSDKRGTQKLYAMMEKAHKARKKAGRGQDTKLRKGLA